MRQIKGSSLLFTFTQKTYVLGIIACTLVKPIGGILVVEVRQVSGVHSILDVSREANFSRLNGLADLNERGHLQPSSTFRILQSPSLNGIEIHSVVRQRRRSPGQSKGLEDVGAKHLPQVLLPAQIVDPDAVVVLVRRPAFDDQVDVVGQQDCRQQQGCEMDAPEEDVHLQPGRVQAGDEHDHGEDELENLAPGRLAELGNEERRVEVGAVNDRNPHVEEEEAKVAVVLVPHAVADEHAVMLALEDANVADVAVPRPRRRDAFTRSAKLPS